MAKAVGQRIAGRLLWENEAAEDGRIALLLTDPKPEADANELLYLRFAFVTVGIEEHLFPSFLIDDWGGEVRGLSVYSWVRENGNRFPRAEIFGYEQNGTSAQFFVRELELYSKLPCYAFANRQAPLAEGKLVQAILLPTPSVQQPEKTKRPSEFKRPLAAARVSWWHVPPTLTQFDFALLDATKQQTD